MTGVELTTWRTARNLTQAELARLLNVNRVTVWRWEVGESHTPKYLRLALETVDGALRQKRKKPALDARKGRARYN